ncbi:BTB/POZ domain-containing protein 2 [Leucoagaricus sp. SymC.cos]|nr:BTB/POZ domain-containing protein 2 [Leucoagaricus sp. SymC.cos]
MTSAPSSSASVNGHNGHANVPPSQTGSASETYEASPASPSSAYPANGYPQAPFPQNSHNEEIVNHLYHSGFQTGNYADTILHVHQNVYRLHAIMLSRSPYLAHLMSTSPQTSGQRVIYVNLEQEPEVTQEGFAIALGYLYSSVSMSMIQASNARAVLAAGCLLGGMEDLCAFAYDVCRRSLSVETIDQWLLFVNSIPSSGDGSGTPDLPQSSVFGLYAQKLRDDVFQFLVTLPDILENTPPQDASSGSVASNARDVLLQVYSRVPFELFKSAVESPMFRIGSDQARFKFAKDAIDLRKRGISRGSGAEETVVLAFGGGNFGGSAVHVTRKLRKRPLWKVNS